ncbi:Os02g0793150 [Oryza sativa Japonica Group]|uniref:Os02g0793150 protein n=1 Tax=Oryza sativa subsp. japonica TaxID=39947 RepID=C7IZ24_ORYSJ|nr:Os02g0793150 [Oryza sativa Japonica Group]|eukprot:NP_001173179.1 Os02g0793150 [Oryza sativa Japonica Group]
METFSRSAAALFTSSSGMYSTAPSVMSSSQPWRSDWISLVMDSSEARTTNLQIIVAVSSPRSTFRLTSLAPKIIMPTNPPNHVFAA